MAVDIIKSCLRVFVCHIETVRMLCLHQSVEGLEKFQHHKVGKKSELTLVWASDDPQKPSESQVMPNSQIFTHRQATLSCNRSFWGLLEVLLSCKISYSKHWAILCISEYSC